MLNGIGVSVMTLLEALRKDLGAESAGRRY